MKVKLLAALKTKFVGVDDAILDRIATKKAEGLTDENQITTLVDGISFTDVLNSYGDFRAGDASQTAVKNYEKKHNLKDGKTIENPNPSPGPKEGDMAELIAKAVGLAVAPLTEKLKGFEQKEAETLRAQEILTKAKEYGIPEKFATKFSIKEDADLDTYFKELKQDFVNEGFKGVQAPETPEQKFEKESAEIAKMINTGTEEIVKQNEK